MSGTEAYGSVSLLGIFARRRAGRIKFQTSSILLKFHPIMSPAIHAHFLLKQSNHEISALVEIGMNGHRRATNAPPPI